MPDVSGYFACDLNDGEAWRLLLHGITGVEYMKEPKLFVKNEKGRYEPYQPPRQEEDNKLYRKVNGKYYPWEMALRMNTLQEGIWVVTRHKSCTSYANARYMREKFHLDKASDIEDVSLSMLGGLEKIAQRVLYELPKDYRNMSTDDLIHLVVGEVYRISNEQNKGGTDED